MESIDKPVAPSYFLAIITNNCNKHCNKLFLLMKYLHLFEGEFHKFP